MTVIFMKTARALIITFLAGPLAKAKEPCYKLARLLFQKPASSALSLCLLGLVLAYMILPSEVSMDGSKGGFAESADPEAFSSDVTVSSDGLANVALEQQEPPSYLEVLRWRDSELRQQPRPFPVHELDNLTETRRFVYPVGNPRIAPSEHPSTNGFHISQHYFNSPKYEGGFASGAWCLLRGRQSKHRSEASCHKAGGRWQHGHTGVDLSNWSSGGAVYAIADGVVHNCSYGYGSYGNIVRLRHDLANGLAVYSLYTHLQSISQAVCRRGVEVTMGQEIAKVGSSGTSEPHLHFSIHKVLAEGQDRLPLGYICHIKTNPNCQRPENQLSNFYDPLLFIDNHQTSIELALEQGVNSFLLPQASSLSNAFVSYQGDSYSYVQAKEMGLLGQDIFVEYPDSSGELRWFSVSQGDAPPYLHPDASYAVEALVGGVSLHLYVAGNQYQEARALQDLLSYTQAQDECWQAERASFSHEPDWAQHWQLYQMDFVCDGAEVTYYQSTSRKDPFRRYVGVLDSALEGEGDAWILWQRQF